MNMDADKLPTDSLEMLYLHEEVVASILLHKYTIPKLDRFGFTVLISSYVIPFFLLFVKNPNPIYFTGGMALVFIFAICCFMISDFLKYKHLNSLQPGYLEVREYFLDLLDGSPVQIEPYEFPYSWMVMKFDFDPFLQHPSFRWSKG